MFSAWDRFTILDVKHSQANFHSPRLLSSIYIYIYITILTIPYVRAQNSHKTSCKTRGIPKLPPSSSGSVRQSSRTWVAKDLHPSLFWPSYHPRLNPNTSFLGVKIGYSYKAKDPKNRPPTLPNLETSRPPPFHGDSPQTPGSAPSVCRETPRPPFRSPMPGLGGGGVEASHS